MTTNHNPSVYPHSEPANKLGQPPFALPSEATIGSAKTIEKLASPIFSASWSPFSPSFNPEIYARGKSHFQITFIFVISRKRRQALTDFYAFCRLADDIADDEGLSIERRNELLDLLTAWVMSDARVNHPFWDRFADARAELGIRNSSLVGIIEGVRMDLKPEVRIHTWEELDLYVYRVACCVGEAVLSILGASGKQADPYALSMGSCLQYLNIMRDIDEDLARNRIYIPAEFLNVRSLENCKSEIRKEFFRRALQFRMQAVPYSWKCFPAEMMASIYLKGARSYWRFGSPQRLSKLQKMVAIVSAFAQTIRSLAVSALRLRPATSF